MDFVIGLLIWLVFGLAAGWLARALFSAVETSSTLTLTFGVLGALVGGMLGVSGYVFHDPDPLRVGGLIGALAGALFFAFLYHYTARKAL